MKTLLFADSILNSLTQIGQQFLSGVPRLVTALVILLIGMIISKMVRKAIKKLLERIKVDAIGEKLNEIEMVQKANIQIKLSDILSKIVYYVLMLFFMVAAADALGMPAVSQLVTDIFNFVPNLIVAFIVLILGLLLSDVVRSLVLTALKSLGVPSAKVISSFLFYFLFINVVVSALSQAKINTAFLSQNISLLIGGGVLAFGIGYGLASRDVIANYLASFYSKDRVNIGDVISVDEKKGEVIDIDKSCITIMTEESRIIVPLSKLTSQSLIIYNKEN